MYPGLLISTNMTAHRIKPSETGENGAKIHGFSPTFRGLNARMAKNTGFENWYHPGCHTHFPDSIYMHVSGGKGQFNILNTGSPIPAEQLRHGLRDGHARL